MDEADKAEHQEQMARDIALTNLHRGRRKTKPLEFAGERVCVGCFEPIEPRRLRAVPDADRCAQCQDDMERYQWTGR